MLTYKTRYTDGGKARTSGLFMETAVTPDVTPPVATLTARGAAEHPHLYPTRSIYINLCTDDPSEKLFVDAFLEGDLNYWRTLEQSPSLRHHIEEWRDAAAVARKSKAFQVIAQEAYSETSKTKFTAAKYLIEEPWKPRAPSTKRRTAKTTQEAFDKAGMAEDAKRLREQGLIN